MNVEALIFQQIVDANFDQAIYTASPNNTINVVQIAAKGSGTNIGLALTPKGTGYISAQVPNGAASGGNARGSRSVDLQTTRAAAGNVASGANSVIGGGDSNTASAAESCVPGGRYNNATGLYSIACGQFSTASGTAAFAAGSSVVASGTASAAFGNSTEASATGSSVFGVSGLAFLPNMFAVGGTTFSGGAQNQLIDVIWLGKTTTNAEVELLVAGTNRAVLRSGTIWTGILQITGSKSDGLAVAEYFRQVAIKRVGNTTSLVGTVNTIGTDEAAGTSISVTADDTNESLKVAATGVTSETWRWQAIFRGGELTYGT
jgi:hypothetical protein